MALASPAQLLRTYGLSPKHSFGQNFLSDYSQAAKIARLAAPTGRENVMEIGAGLGALTNQLLLQGAYVSAVERDRDLIPALEDIFSEERGEGALELLEADAKTLDWEETLAKRGASSARPWVLAGNLPYQITGPLLERSVRMARKIARAVYLVQREVADRLAASPGTKTYGALSVFVQAQFVVKREFVIKPGAFLPAPRVDSAVISLTPRKDLLTEETGEFRKVVKSAFAARRKTLRNAWKSLLPADDLASMAEQCGVSLDQRGETLSVETFAEMARKLTAWQPRQD